jgi:hypothetical protein
MNDAPKEFAAAAVDVELAEVVEAVEVEVVEAEDEGEVVRVTVAVDVVPAEEEVVVVDEAFRGRISPPKTLAGDTAVPLELAAANW